MRNHGCRMLFGTLLLTLALALGCGGTEDPQLPTKTVDTPLPAWDVALGETPEVQTNLNKLDPRPVSQPVVQRTLRLGPGGSLIVDEDKALDRVLAGDFTVELWIKLQTASDQRALEVEGLQIGLQARRVQVKAGRVIVSGPIIGTSEWYHLSVVVAADTLTLFVNGVPSGEARVEASWTPRGALTLGGETRDEADPFSGDIDNLRVMSGARHDASFTPDQTVDQGDPSFSFDFDGTSRSDEVLSAGGHRAVLHGEAKLVQGAI